MRVSVNLTPLTKMPIDIIYEDDDILAVNKPAGLTVHSDGKRVEETLVDLILKKYPNIKDVGEPIIVDENIQIERSGIVHRLDRETSGVILVAKTKEAHEHLKNQFQERTIEKKYHAFVYGRMKYDRGEIDRAIGRSKNDFRKWTAQRGSRGKLRDALTMYKVLGRSSEATLVELTPKTGRTHQIRVHMKAINHPVVADGLYASGQKPLLGFERLALHAREISFNNLEGKRITVSAKYPEDFLSATNSEPFNNLNNTKS